MSHNRKAYEVTLSGGEILTVQANDVQVINNRVTFVGHVDGHVSGSYETETVVSYRADLVDAYRLVPVPEEEAKAVGSNVYRFSLTDGSRKDVQGDFVTHAPGTDGQPGRYVVGTRLKGVSTGRTEYVVPENLVEDIERVIDASVPAQATAKA